MYIHTIVPLDIVFTGVEQLTNADRKIVHYKGIKIEVQDKKQDEYQIVRIFSTNINDYLNKEIQPGMTIKKVSVTC